MTGGLPPEKLIDRTFLMPPEEDGTRHRAKIMKMIDDHRTSSKLEEHPDRIKFKCLVNNKYEEVVAYNDIADYIEADQTWDGMWQFRKIHDHKYVKPSQTDEYMKSSVNVLVEYETGETLWQPLHRLDRAGVFRHQPCHRRYLCT